MCLRLEASSCRAGYEYILTLVWAFKDLEIADTLFDVLSLPDPYGILTTRLGIVALEGFPTAATAYQKARSELIQSYPVVRDRQHC